MDRLKYIKLENEDGSYSSSIPLAVNSDYVDVNGNTLTNELNNKANNSSINNLQNQINSLASGSPLVASSTSSMTDTTRIYVNSTDGHWYWYDGDSWEDGGTYQATEVADNSIDILKLDNILQSNFTKEYTNVDLGTATTGHYKYVNDNAIADQSNPSYVYYDIALDANTIYNFSGFNNYTCPAIIVYDSSDNSIVYTSTISDPSDIYENVSLTFKTNKSGLKAYVNNRASFTTITPRESILLVTLSKINDITQNNKQNYINKLRELEGYCFVTDEPLTDINTMRLQSNEFATLNFYKISKGTKYYVSSSNIFNYSGITILDEDLELSYKSTDQNAGSTPVPVYYEFTASNDGYVALLDFNWTGHEFTHNIYIVKPENKYVAKKWALIGDSLTDPNANSTVKKYYSYIQDDLNIKLQNLGQAGCGYKRKYNEYTKNFVEQSLLLDSDVDVVTIFGSFNDNVEFSNMGTVNDTTTDTILGCVYTTIYNIITNNPNAKIGVILPTPWGSYNPYNISDNINSYIEGIRAIAKKFSIPVLDLFYESNLYPWISSFKSSYFVNNDGVHPNSDGNKRFAYQIEDFIKKLI